MQTCAINVTSLSSISGVANHGADGKSEQTSHRQVGHTQCLASPVYGRYSILFIPMKRFMFCISVGCFQVLDVYQASVNPPVIGLSSALTKTSSG